MASHMLHRASHAKGKVRNSSIELLRVIAMLLIVTQHSVVHSTYNPSTAPLSVPMLFATMLGQIRQGLSAYCSSSVSAHGSCAMMAIHPYDPH